MSVRLHNTKLSEYGEAIYSDDAFETLQYIYTLALADVRQDFDKQDFDNNKWLSTGDDLALEWIEMSPELATEVIKALRERKNTALADQLEACMNEAKHKWGQEAVRLELW